MTPGMNGLGKLVVFTVLVMTLGSAAAVFFAPPTAEEARKRRQAEAQRLVDRLNQATWNYFHERGTFPPGDGSASATLVSALRSPSRGGAPYMRFLEEMLTPDGDLRNPISPQTMVLYYRNNRDLVLQTPGGHNRLNFDLWGMSTDGAEDGINNWDSVIVSAP